MLVWFILGVFKTHLATLGTRTTTLMHTRVYHCHYGFQFVLFYVYVKSCAEFNNAISLQHESQIVYYSI